MQKKNEDNQKRREKVETVEKRREMPALINKSGVASLQDLHFYTQSSYFFKLHTYAPSVTYSNTHGVKI